METRTSGRMEAALRGGLAALAAGYICFFFSETLFWGRPGRAPILELVATWLVYSVLTYLTLACTATFRAQGWAMLFLAGAVYGWLGEGVLVQTMYAAFPVNLSWTGLAWHAPLSVCAGFCGLAIALQRGARPTVLVSGGLGVFWGVWAVMWWQPEEGGHVTPIFAWGQHAFWNAVLVIVAHAAFSRLYRPSAFQSRWAQGVLCGIALLWFFLVAVPAAPSALIIAPPLFALTLMALRRLDSQSANAGFLLALRPVPALRYLNMLVMPLCATAVYALFLATGYTYPTNRWVFYVATPGGALAYLAALRLAFRSKRPE